ncbi:Uncharacterised protein [Mycobacteroides abscessus subsp. abscessus]|nr:Uncharacterised protein [Mycobacteroides abscessus subsp. abscessus]
MRWAGWWLGPLLGGIGAYAVYVLLREIWGNLPDRYQCERPGI